MKKNYLVLLLMIIFGFNVNAQCPLTNAVDFTVTDINGQQHKLFNYLDSGKYVLIDFFYTTCGPCQQTAPKVQGAYENFGCNTGNVIFLSIDQGDNNAEIAQFDNTFGIHCPGISGLEGGGNAVVSTYGITSFPTVILIAPNKNIVKQDIWPIADAAYLNSVISGQGGIPKACSNGINDGSESKKNQILSLYPNPASEIATLKLELLNKSSIQVLVYNIIGAKVVELPVITYEEGIHSVQIPLNTLENGSYFVKILNGSNILSSEKLVIIK